MAIAKSCRAHDENASYHIHVLAIWQQLKDPPLWSNGIPSYKVSPSLPFSFSLSLSLSLTHTAWQCFLLCCVCPICMHNSNSLQLYISYRVYWPSVCFSWEKHTH